MQSLQPSWYEVQTNQPGSQEPPEATLVSGITIRALRNTPEDAAFAARLQVEAFEDKFAHSVTREKLPTAIKILTVFFQDQYPQFYTRNLVAEMNGRLVGYMGIKFRGDRDKDNVDYLSELGCWHMCRFICFGCVMDTSSSDIEPRACLVECIGVDAFARGKGVGKLLLDRAEYEARKRGATMMYLMVITTNRAIHLYERQGYRIAETHNSCCFKCVAGPPGSYHVMKKQLT